MKPSEPKTILDVSGLKTYFYSSRGAARAVDGVSFHLRSGEVLGVVGESGSGKSVTALSIMQLIPDPPGKIVDGRVHFDGTNLLDLSRQQMRRIRGNRIAMIFQEPMTSLNPVFTIGNQISEMFILHRNAGRKEALEASIEMLHRVQIPAPQRRIHEYPHQLSGGMRQRAMIAMALACDPEILIADEPTTALDVTVQAQILELMLKLKEDFGTAVQMITHDLGVIAEMAQRIVVMYAGRVVEEAPTLEIFKRPLHPYTVGLLQSIPILGSRTAGETRRLREIKGMVPSLVSLPEGCKFGDRCPRVMEICRQREPELTDITSGRRVRCWLHVEPPAS
ncbi:putative peptide ABC transporter ATP-binding protein y4tR [Desulfosarcina widdelii]|uniref:Putative peptide ABC transporter ATP-binding protein y4tR n=1 Tax=Desulfosarcina widdelii TaxID=947919 RepID=A0A5K7Z5A0_9BACT|nr:ABC transporter ATP-binding protein [Desulfosarcina widdelii]BBO75399.1 putative peptide ABC transporter ATP-binding protein y4tR [Desulfosarcina widdelii]